MESFTRWWHMLELSQEKMFFPFTLLQPTGERKSTNTAKRRSSRDEKPKGWILWTTLQQGNKRRNKKLSQNLFPSLSQGISDAFPQSGNCGAQNQSKTVQRNSLQWETLKSWHSYRDIQPGFARTIFYKLSMCLLWKENMFFPVHNLIHYHQPLFSETVIWIHYPFLGLHFFKR